VTSAIVTVRQKKDLRQAGVGRGDGGWQKKQHRQTTQNALQNHCGKRSKASAGPTGAARRARSRSQE
jgi:hypothetical protein